MNDKIETNAKIVSPFKRFCMTIGELPSSYKESMTYYETLLWLIKYLEDTVIPAVNNNAEALKELQGLFTELQEYVDNYFEDLDVQEEINNKLDAMAESGELIDIIAQYLGLAGILVYPTLADLKLADNLAVGSICKTLGYASVNDGGGATYKVRAIINSDVTNDATLIALSDNSLVAEYVYEGSLNVKQFGVTLNGVTDDTEKLQLALDYIDNIGGGYVYVPSGTAIISYPLLINSNTILYGDNNATLIKGNASFPSGDYRCMIKNRHHMMDLTEYHDRGIIIKNISFDNNNDLNAGHDGLIHFRGVTDSKIENVNITASGSNCWGIILFSANQHVTVDNCHVYNTSADNSNGGCIWVRSGLNAENVLNRKSYGINVTNCTLESSAKDEILCIADGITGGWTEVNVNNCTIYGKALTNYSSAGIIINAVGDDSSFVKANVNNINMFGNVNLAGIIVGASGISETATDVTLSNLNIKLDHASRGIRGYYRVPVSNSYIEVPSGNPSVVTVHIVNSKLIGFAQTSELIGCDVTGNATNGVTNCPLVESCKIRGNNNGIQSYGSMRARYINNEIIANTRGIYGQLNNNVGLYQSVITGNIIYRPEATSNSGTNGIEAQYSDYCIIENNRVSSTNGTASTSIGYLYGTQTANSTHLVKSENDVIVS